MGANAPDAMFLGIVLHSLPPHYLGGGLSTASLILRKPFEAFKPHLHIFSLKPEVKFKGLPKDPRLEGGTRCGGGTLQS